MKDSYSEESLLDEVTENITSSIASATPEAQLDFIVGRIVQGNSSSIKEVHDFFVQFSGKLLEYFEQRKDDQGIKDQENFLELKKALLNLSNSSNFEDYIKKLASRECYGYRLKDANYLLDTHPPSLWRWELVHFEQLEKSRVLIIRAIRPIRKTYGKLIRSIQTIIDHLLKKVANGSYELTEDVNLDDPDSLPWSVQVDAKRREFEERMDKNVIDVEKLKQRRKLKEESDVQKSKKKDSVTYYHARVERSRLNKEIEAINKTIEGIEAEISQIGTKNKLKGFLSSSTPTKIIVPAPLQAKYDEALEKRKELQNSIQVCEESIKKLLDSLPENYLNQEKQYQENQLQIQAAAAAIPATTPGTAGSSKQINSINKFLIASPSTGASNYQNNSSNKSNNASVDSEEQQRNDQLKKDLFLESINSNLSFDTLLRTIIQENKEKKLLKPKRSSKPKTVKISVTISSSNKDMHNPFSNNETYDEVVEKVVNNKIKFLQFAEDLRHPYEGTFSKKSLIIKGKCPFTKDNDLFNYNYDSEAEWEEEDEGEDIGDSDDDDDDEVEGDNINELEIDGEFFLNDNDFGSDVDSDGEEITSVPIINARSKEEFVGPYSIKNLQVSQLEAPLNTPHIIDAKDTIGYTYYDNSYNEFNNEDVNKLSKYAAVIYQPELLKLQYLNVISKRQPQAKKPPATPATPVSIDPSAVASNTNVSTEKTTDQPTQVKAKSKPKSKAKAPVSADTNDTPTDANTDTTEVKVVKPRAKPKPKAKKVEESQKDDVQTSEETKEEETIQDESVQDNESKSKTPSKPKAAPKKKITPILQTVSKVEESSDEVVLLESSAQPPNPKTTPKKKITPVLQPVNKDDNSSNEAVVESPKKDQSLITPKKTTKSAPKKKIAPTKLVEAVEKNTEVTPSTPSETTQPIDLFDTKAPETLVQVPEDTSTSGESKPKAKPKATPKKKAKQVDVEAKSNDKDAMDVVEPPEKTSSVPNTPSKKVLESPKPVNKITSFFFMSPKK